LIGAFFPRRSWACWHYYVATGESAPLDVACCMQPHLPMLRARYIVGINQIYDVDIDRMNKPFLPVAAGVQPLPAASALSTVVTMGACCRPVVRRPGMGSVPGAGYR
jgi:hypothetical protein